MPSTIIELVDDLSRNIYLTGETLDCFGLEPDTGVILKAGSATTTAELKSSQNGNYVSLALITALGLPKIQPVRLIIEDDKSLRLGPLIGILISRGKKHKTPPYSSQGKLLYNFLSYGMQANCLTYVFTPNGIDIVNKKIKGLFLDINAERKIVWKSHEFPLPDVVYDRILFRTIERKKKTKAITSFLQNETGIKYFNPKFLNKWETHAILYENPLLHPHLPHTKKYKDFADLILFLDDYGTVYLKPVNGSLGKGIIRVTRQNQDFCCQYREGTQITTRFWKSTEELRVGVQEYIGRHIYILQQGLNLQKYTDRVFDIRVLMQKNGQGQWEKSAVVARVASNGSIFPNIAAGGKPVNIERLWEKLMFTQWPLSDISILIDQVSLRAAKTLEKNLGTFGEIGLDIGVDTHSNIWIIEINSKPSRKVFPKDQMDLKTKSIMLPIDFSVYLAGFASAQGSGPQ